MRSPALHGSGDDIALSPQKILFNRWLKNIKAEGEQVTITNQSKQENQSWAYRIHDHSHDKHIVPIYMIQAYLHDHSHLDRICLSRHTVYMTTYLDRICLSRHTVYMTMATISISHESFHLLCGLMMRKGISFAFAVSLFASSADAPSWKRQYNQAFRV
jgi:hypothetical protein